MDLILRRKYKYTENQLQNLDAAGGDDNTTSIVVIVKWIITIVVVVYGI